MAMARPHTPPQAAQPKPLPRDAPVEFQSSPQTPMAPLMLGKDKATWLELSTGEKAAAIQLGYHETLWNTGGAPREVYKVHWNELDEIKLKAAKDENIVEDDNGYTLTIFNQDGSQRMQISGERLCWNDMLKGGEVHDFIAAFKLSLFSEEPTTKQMADQRHDLAEKKNSVLFNGYGWKLEVNGETYEKN